MFDMYTIFLSLNYTVESTSHFVVVCRSLHHLSFCVIDGAPSGKDCSWYSLDDKSSYSESAAGLVCRNPGCEHIQFTSKVSSCLCIVSFKLS